MTSSLFHSSHSGVLSFVAGSYARFAYQRAVMMPRVTYAAGDVSRSGGGW